MGVKRAEGALESDKVVDDESWFEDGRAGKRREGRPRFIVSSGGVSLILAMFPFLLCLVHTISRFQAINTVVTTFVDRLRSYVTKLANKNSIRPIFVIHHVSVPVTS